jgi:cytochrome c-type biogenesis protein
MTVTIGLAFIAGLASFLSPCVFSLVPAYVGYLSGRTMATVSAGDHTFRSSRLQALSHGLAFVLGFSVVFILLGLAASAIGQALYDVRPVIAKFGGVVVVLFGLHLTGILRIPFLEYDLRPQTTMDERRGYLASAMMGVFFSAGWSPCVGPVLGSILMLALDQGSIGHGAQLLASYSAGLAIPFLIAAVAIGSVTKVIMRYRKAMHYVEIAMGVVLIIVGAMLFLGIFEQMARFGFFIDFGL